jgi:hypothetical protein
LSILNLKNFLLPQHHTTELLGGDTTRNNSKLADNIALPRSLTGLQLWRQYWRHFLGSFLGGHISLKKRS